MAYEFTKSNTEPICSVYNGSIQADLPLSLVKICTGWHVCSPNHTLNQSAMFITDPSRQIYQCHWLRCTGWHVSSPNHTLNQSAVYNGSIQADLSLSLVKMCTGWHVSSPSQTPNQSAMFITDPSRQFYHCHWLRYVQDGMSVHQVKHRTNLLCL